jgi:O-acetyl-ADP-ribose deacetylase (regulator of RNase III)
MFFAKNKFLNKPFKSIITSELIMEKTNMPKIEVKKASITNAEVNAIVNPANSFGYMGGGVAGVIKKVGGQVIEDEAIAQAPVQVGEAILTSAGDLICHKIIHAPTMHNPAEKTDAHKVFCAAKAALELADKEGFRSIAMPGMGTGVGGLDKLEAAKTIVKAVKSTKFQSLEKILLIDIDDEMIEAFEKVLKS